MVERPLPTASPDVIARAVSDGAVLLSTRDEVYFGLNSVGWRIWQLLPPVVQSMTELCGRLQVEYPEVDSGTLRADVEELLEALCRYGLAVEASPNGRART